MFEVPKYLRNQNKTRMCTFDYKQMRELLVVIEFQRKHVQYCVELMQNLFSYTYSVTVMLIIQYGKYCRIFGLVMCIMHVSYAGESQVYLCGATCRARNRDRDKQLTRVAQVRSIFEEIKILNVLFICLNFFYIYHTAITS